MRPPCTIEGCDKPNAARGLCDRHYMRWKMHGDPNVVLSNYGKPPRERLLAKINQDGSGCWLWRANTDTDGYGILKVGGKNRKAHRVAYEEFVGPIPEGLQLDHLCRNPPCVNPDHLEPVTPGENQRRGRNGILKTHCRNGHPYTPDIVIWRGKPPRRNCRICLAAAIARSNAKKRKKVA